MHVNNDFGEGKIDYAQQTSSRMWKQKCNSQTLSLTSGSIGEEHIKGETSLNKPMITNLLEFLFNIEWVCLCISLFCLFWLTIYI